MVTARTCLIVALGLVAVSVIVVGSGGASSVSDGAAGTNIEFREVSTEAGFVYNTTEPSGVISNAGVYATDYDGDGWTDVLAVGANRPVLFDNDGGQFSASGQLESINASFRSAVVVDYDADGDDDIILLARDRAPVVLNNANGTFERAHGVLNVTLDRPVGASANDYDRDGCPDLFVIQNGDWSSRLPEGDDRLDVSPVEDNGTPNLLFDGDCGSFENVTGEAGVRGSTWTLAASMIDLDGDGLPDIHVANDFNNDVIYWNDGDGTFTRQILANETNRNGMASEIEDFSGDGRPDVFVTNIFLPPSVDGDVAFVAGNRSEGNNLLLNEGDRRFDPAGKRCGVHRGGWGWAAVGTDFDNDRDTDLFHTTLEFTGRLGRELLRARQTSPDYSYPVLFERTSPATCGFESMNASAAGFEETDGHGAAQVDFDRDGDVDIAMAVSAGPTGNASYRLYENTGETGAALQARIVGESRTEGARVFVETDSQTQMRVDHSRTDYFSQDERVLHFGLGNHSDADVRVVWPDGSERTFENVSADTRLVISRNGLERTVQLDGPPGRSVIAGPDMRGRFVVVAAVMFVLAAAGLSRHRSR